MAYTLVNSIKDRMAGVFDVRNRLAQPVDNTFLVLFRIGFGCLMFWQIWSYFNTDWIRTYFIEPRIHFPFLGFAWVRELPESVTYACFHVMGAAALCLALGLFYRGAAFLFWAGYTYFFLMDQSWYLNHNYLICLISFLCIFLPANRAGALDCWRNPRLYRDTAPTWALWLLRFQVGIPYFFGGIAKLNSDWLAGEPMRTWLADWQNIPVVGAWVTQEWCVVAFVWGGLLIDLLAFPFLLWRWTRWPMMALLLAFHLMNSQLFRIGVFPWLMIMATATCFIPPEIWARLRFWYRAPSDVTYVPSRPLSPFTTCLLGLYVMSQLLLPLRHCLYPGNTAFTREGHYFSWRMKLNNRSMSVKYTVADPRDGSRWQVPLSDWLTTPQERNFRTADMILQLAHAIARNCDTARGGNHQVFVQATVALNGRPKAPFVDPNVDLASVPRSWTPSTWIYRDVPLPAISGSQTASRDDGSSRRD